MQWNYVMIFLAHTDLQISYKRKREKRINAELGVLTFAVPKDLVSLQIKNYFSFVCHCV